jgi:hypothetical protein
MAYQAGGSVAFKVTWVYGKRGPFTSPCTAQGRFNNIEISKKTWCSDAACPCRQMYDDDEDSDYDGWDGKWPCYDSAIFDKWSFGAGVYHTGSRSGQEIPFTGAKAGKFAFFTSRNHEMEEKDRIIIGCYKIEKVGIDSDFNLYAVSASKTRYRVKNLKQAPKFWNFHKQEAGPKWHTGLFRYIPDDEAMKMFNAVMRTGVAV